MSALMYVCVTLKSLSSGVNQLWNVWLKFLDGTGYYQDSKKIEFEPQSYLYLESKTLSYILNVTPTHLDLCISYRAVIKYLLHQRTFMN